MSSSFITFASGLVLLGVAVGVVAFGSWGAARRLLPDWRGLPLALASTVITLTCMVGVVQVIGSVGQFGRGPAFVGLIAVGAGLWSWGRSERASSRPEGPKPSDIGPPTVSPRLHRLDLGFAAVAVVVVVAEWGQRTWWALNHGIHTIDSLWYHLPVAARWVQTGSITPLHYLEDEALTTFFPGNGSIFHAIGMSFLGIDILSVFMNLGWLAFGLMAAWCLGRPFGTSWLSVGAAAIGFTTPSLMATQPGGAYNDTMGIALLLASLALLANGHQGGGRFDRAALALASIAAGLAVGTKFQFLLPVGALSLAVVIASSRESRIRVSALWAGVLAVTGSFWYLRNWVIVGNPLPQMELDLGPLEFHKTPIFTKFSTVAAHLGSASDRDLYLWPGMDKGVGALWWLLLGGLGVLLIAGLVTGLRMQRIICLVAGITVAGFLVTPAILGFGGKLVYFGVVTRYLAPGIVLSAVAAAAATRGRASVWRYCTIGVLGVYLVSIQVEASDWEENLEAAIDQPIWGVASLVWIGWAALALALGVAARRWLPRLDRRAVMVGVCVLVVAGGLASVTARRVYLSNRYQDYAGVLKLIDLSWSSRFSGERIGIAGTPLQYPVYGPDQANYVQYIGVPQPRSGWRTAKTCEEWRTSINEGRFTLVVVLSAWFTTTPVVDLEWTGGDSAAEKIYERDSARVFRINGSMDPDGCEGDGSG
ncbi:MAG: hypothetical protein IPG97_01905 [Microthrixaceae bacterium]|nr:hypothetical protein [Microthrixaceae bacterium]